MGMAGLPSGVTFRSRFVFSRSSEGKEDRYLPAQGRGCRGQDEGGIGHVERALGRDNRHRWCMGGLSLGHLFLKTAIEPRIQGRIRSWLTGRSSQARNSLSPPKKARRESRAGPSRSRGGGLVPRQVNISEVMLVNQPLAYSTSSARVLGEASVDDRPPAPLTGTIPSSVNW